MFEGSEGDSRHIYIYTYIHIYIYTYIYIYIYIESVLASLHRFVCCVTNHFLRTGGCCSRRSKVLGVFVFRALSSDDGAFGLPVCTNQKGYQVKKKWASHVAP